MQRLNAAFLAVVLVAAGFGVLASAGYGGELDARSETGIVASGVAVDVTGLAFEDDELRVTTTLRNPTDEDLTVTGTVVRVHNATEPKLAFGTGSLVSGETALPAGGSTTATYSIQVAPSKASALRQEVSADGVSVTTKHSVRFRGVSTQVVATDGSPTRGGR